MPNENYATDQKTFFTDWQLNCQLSNNKMCFTFGLKASKPKNSTEAIYEWNPQLLSCQSVYNTY